MNEKEKFTVTKSTTYTINVKMVGYDYQIAGEDEVYDCKSEIYEGHVVTIDALNRETIIAKTKKYFEYDKAYDEAMNLLTEELF